MEHRYGRRWPLHVPVLLRTAQGNASQAFLRDISSSGAQLACLAHVPVGARLQVYVLDGGTHSPRAAGEVVRICEGGFAIEWMEFSPELVKGLLSQQRANALQPPRTTETQARSAHPSGSLPE
jgi:PilZ domain